MFKNFISQPCKSSNKSIQSLELQKLLANSMYKMPVPQRRFQIEDIERRVRSDNTTPMWFYVKTNYVAAMANNYTISCKSKISTTFANL